MYVVGWNIGPTTAWCRITQYGDFIEWGECSNSLILEVISYLKRYECKIIVEVMSEKDLYRCSTCTYAIERICKSWPRIVWVTRRQWSNARYTELPLPQNTNSVLRRDAFYIAQWGVISNNRGRNV